MYSMLYNKNISNSDYIKGTLHEYEWREGVSAIQAEYGLSEEEIVDEINNRTNFTIEKLAFFRRSFMLEDFDVLNVFFLASWELAQIDLGFELFDGEFEIKPPVVFETISPLPYRKNIEKASEYLRNGLSEEKWADLVNTFKAVHGYGEEEFCSNLDTRRNLTLEDLSYIRVNCKLSADDFLTMFFPYNEFRVPYIGDAG